MDVGLRIAQEEYFVLKNKGLFIFTFVSVGNLQQTADNLKSLGFKILQCAQGFFGVAVIQIPLLQEKIQAEERVGAIFGWLIRLFQ